VFIYLLLKYLNPEGCKMIKNAAKVITKIKRQVPLVQAITNYVTINDCANILLAYGASPAMVEAYDEAYAFAGISSAIYVNVGTLTKEQELAAIEASISAKMNQVPLILDPVGCAAIPRKLQIIRKMLERGRIDVIKGNAGEIKFLAGVESKARGVDSVDDGDGLLEASMKLAQMYNCIVAATGKVDIVTDGKKAAFVHNGVEMLTKITGAGCMLGALCAAACGVEEDTLLAATAAVVSMGIAGEMAYEESKLPGTFKCKLIDSIYLLDGEILEKEGKLEWK
jgi:hydroxyethylthiazole kinase